MHRLEKILHELLDEFEKSCSISPKNSCTSWEKVARMSSKKKCTSWKNMLLHRLEKILHELEISVRRVRKKVTQVGKILLKELDKIIGRVRKKLHELVGKNLETCLSLQVNSTWWRLKVSELRRHFNFGTWS